MTSIAKTVWDKAERAMRRLLGMFGSPGGRRFLTITTGKVVAAILQALFFAVFAHLMGLGPFGEFSIGYSLTLVTMSLFEFGFGSLSLRIAREDDPGRTLATILIIRAGTNVVVVAGITAIWGSLLSHGALVGLCVALFAIGETWANLVQNLLIGLLRERLSMLLLILRRVALLGMALAVGWLDHGAGPHEGFLIAGAGGLIFNVIGTSLFVVGKFSRPYNPVHFVSKRRRFWATSLADNARQLDVVIVGALGGPSLAGLFAAANRLITPLGLLTSSLIQSLVPELIRRSNNDDENHRYVRRVVHVMTYYGVAIIAASAVSPWLITWLYGKEFFDAWPITIAAFFVTAFSAVNQCYFAWEYTRGIALYLPIAMATITIVYLLAMTVASLSGSVWAVTVAMIVVAAGGHIFYRARFAQASGI